MNQSKIASCPTVLIVGKSQTCKSSIIMYLSGGKARIPIGQNFSGRSTTSEVIPVKIKNPYLYDGQEFLILDTIGLGDSDERFTDSEIMGLIENALMKHSSSNYIDAILVTESLLSDNVTLNIVLSKLQELMGESCVNSIIVLGTKPDPSKKKYVETRINSLNKIIKTNNIKAEVFPFMTPFLEFTEEKIGTRQLEILGQMLSEVPKVYLKVLQDRRNNLIERAMEIRLERTENKDVKLKYMNQKVQWQKGKQTITVPVTKKKRILAYSETKIRHETITFDIMIPLIEDFEDYLDHTEKNVPPFDSCLLQALEEHEASVRERIKERMAK